MASTRSALREITANVDESMGVRQFDPGPQFSPRSSPKDIGRRPLRQFGRLKVDQITADPNQPRGEFDDSEIQRLASSIRHTGQLHPIRVRWDADAARWIIVTGERRYRATVVAGLQEIDCYFHDDDITESEILEQQLVENLLRQDLKPLEEARGYLALMELNGWNGKQLAEALRVTTSRVSRSLALLDLPDHIQQQVDDGSLPKSSAYEIGRLPKEDARSELAAQAASGKLTHAQTANRVRQRRGKKPAKARGVSQVFATANGIKVTVNSKRKCNYYEIEEALTEAIEEVRHRINNNVQIY